MEIPGYSILVPLYNEVGNLRLIQERINAVMAEVSNSYELLFVDDGSSDGSWELIKAMAAGNRKVRGVSLSRNFGHQVAIMAGLEHARGEVVIMMDADLQHPPELIPEMLKMYRQGFEIVNTIRTGTDGISPAKDISSRIFYKLLNFLSGTSIKSGAADFRLMGRTAVEAFLRMPERDRFSRGLISWMGFRQAFIPYQAGERQSGKSKYSAFRMIRFALDAVTSFSSRPLRISFYVGMITFMAGLVYSAYAIYRHQIGATIPGWTSLLLVVLFLGGFQLVSLGIIGEYIARIFDQSKARPLYFVRDITG